MEIESAVLVKDGASGVAPIEYVVAEAGSGSACGAWHAVHSVKNLKAGYHAFSVLGTDGKGNIRPSGPMLVVVRK